MNLHKPELKCKANSGIVHIAVAPPLTSAGQFCNLSELFWEMCGLFPAPLLEVLSRDYMRLYT